MNMCSHYYETVNNTSVAQYGSCLVGCNLRIIASLRCKYFME